MNFKKPSEKSAIETLASVGGFIGGAAASRGAFGLVHDPKGVTEADIKSDRTAGYVKRAAIVVAAAAAASALVGTDTASMAVKSALYGIAGMQILDGVKDYSATNATTAALATSAKPASKFAARALGLGCPCQEGALGKPRRRGRGSRLRGYEIPTSEFGPAYDVSATATGAKKSLEQIYMEAKQAA